MEADLAEQISKSMPEFKLRRKKEPISNVPGF
jgi:hypothetical protein